MECLPLPAKRQGLNLDPKRQAHRLCVLPGFDLSKHPRCPSITNVWMGLPRDYAHEGSPGWAYPPEPILETGCPSSWIHSRFVASLKTYYRGRTTDGNRVDNRALNLTEDPLVIEAIETLEAFEEQAHSVLMATIHAKQMADAKKAG